ncbi:MAG: hypothetical protein KY428_03100, partial [Bacteroidetes bacterium]|nr:hypothetical protein [Bacteroidota bacterium]
MLRAQDSVNIDSLYQQARQLAIGGAYPQSRQLCRQLLQLAPYHTDASLLMGQSFAWQEQFDSARLVLLPLLAKPQPPEPAFLALANAERWAGNSEKSLAHSRAGLQQYPASVDLLLAGAQILLQLEDEGAAAHLLQKAVAIDPGNQEAERLQSSLKQKGSLNSIKALYQISTFSTDMAPWQLGTLEYQHAA